MKLIVVVPDGMCDVRYPELGGKSPAEYARTPGMDAVVRQGQVGLVQTMYPGLPLGSLVGFLGILGYDPRQYFPLGRSVFEAHAIGVTLEARDLAFRCNIVRVSDDDHLTDFTAGQIDDQSAEAYLAQVQLPDSFDIHHDLSYRNVLVYHDCDLNAHDMRLFEPHENMGTPIRDILPQYQGQPFKTLVDLILDSRRGDLMLWPWGVSRARTFPQMSRRLTTITGLSFLSGMTSLLGGQAVMPPGATGYLNTDLDAKLAALLDCLPEVEVGIIHCNAPDEESHVFNLETKVRAIENIDRQVVSPLLEYIAGSDEPHRLLVCPDHYTCCDDGKHRDFPVPYAFAGGGAAPNHALGAYSEVEVVEHIGQVGIQGYALISTLLSG